MAVLSCQTVLPSSAYYGIVAQSMRQLFRLLHTYFMQQMGTRMPFRTMRHGWSSMHRLCLSNMKACNGTWQVRVMDGSVCDKFVVEEDFVHLSHAHGVHLLGDRLAILALRTQQHHLLQVPPSSPSPIVVEARLIPTHQENRNWEEKPVNSQPSNLHCPEKVHDLCVIFFP